MKGFRIHTHLSKRLSKGDLIYFALTSEMEDCVGDGHIFCITLKIIINSPLSVRVVWSGGELLSKILRYN